MATLYAVAGSKIYIGTEKSAKGTVTEADFTDEVWTEIGGWTQAGAVGDEQEVIEQAVISDNRVRKMKGPLNGGTMENLFLPDPTDAGQIAMKAAVASNNPFSFKIEWGGAGAAATATDKFFALVLPRSKQGGEANTAQIVSWNIAVDSNIVES